MSQGPNSKQQGVKWYRLIRKINFQSNCRNDALKSEWPSLCEMKTDNKGQKVGFSKEHLSYYTHKLEYTFPLITWAHYLTLEILSTGLSPLLKYVFFIISNFSNR